MKGTFKIIALLNLLFLGIAGFSQGISNKGKEFWVGYGHHQFMETGSNTQNMTLYLSAEEQAATVTVVIDSSGLFAASWWRRTYNIPAYTVISIEDVNANTYSTAAGPKGSIPKGVNGQYDARLFTDAPPAGTGGAGLFRKKGIKITSDVPIVAYAHIWGSTSSGATTLIPVEAWGYDYVSINSKQQYAANCYSWMYVIASRDNTVIEITPSVLTRAQDKTGLRPGQTTQITLMKGQIYQVIGANEGADANGNGGTSSSGKELTGTKIRSIAQPGGDCYPIAVFSGSSRTSNPASCGSGGGDNDNYQMYPQHAWGKRYLLAPFSSGAGVSDFATSTYKIISKDPSSAATNLSRNGGPPLTMVNGLYQFESSATEYITADKPITIVQFMHGGNCMPGTPGDPSMVAISPIEQGIKQVGFYRNSQESISINYLTLIVPTAGLASLRIDNSNVFDHTYAHGKLPGYSVVVKRWAAQKAQVIVKCDSAFNAVTYGLGSVESYAYSAGAYFNNLNAVSDLTNTPDTTNGGKNSHPYTCINTPVKLSVLMRYQPLTLSWTLNQLCNVVTPCADFVMNPASTYFTDSVTKDGIKYYRYTLPGTYTFNKAGLYDIRIRSTSLSLDNCNNQEDLTITIDVKPKPNINFSITHPTRCSKDTVMFNGPAASGNGYTVGYWDWTFTGGVKDSVQNPKHLFDTGAKTARLYIATTFGCAADTTIKFTVVPPPKATFGVTPPAVCLGQAITFSDTSSYTGPLPRNRWYWDFGNGTTIDAASDTNHTITYATTGQYVVKHVVKVSPLCISDTATKIVPVHPGAVLGFTYPQGCLPPSGVAQFGADAVDVGGQAIVSYLWNFGDAANSTPANPNTSTLQNPIHTYSGFGNYTVTLSVVTASGCSGDTSVVISMNVQPTTTFGSLDSICANASVVSVAKGAVTNNVPGRGKYYGPGTDTLGNFDPAVAGPGTHEILYVFTSDGGCFDTARQNITVNPLPAKPTVTAAFRYCQNDAATVLTATGDAGNTFTWYDNAVLTGGSNAAPTPSTASADSIHYYVTQTSQYGCVSDTSRITVVIKPAIDGNVIGIDQTLCSSGASADTLRSQSTISGGDRTLNFQWQQSADGGNTWTDITGATSANYFPGSINGERKFRRLISSGLCTSTSNVVTVTIVAGFTNFDISANQNVCEGTAPALLDGETATGGGTISYQWQVSTDSTSWTDIAGATAEDYQPAALDSTRFYRRVISNSVCTATSSVVKVAVTKIANGSIAGPAVICAYDSASITFTSTAGTAPYTLVLAVTNPGGTTTSLSRTFATGDPTIVEVIGANSASGVYNISVTSLSDINGCVRTTGFSPVSITVNPKPVLSVSPSIEICSGSTDTLRASGADTYSWFPSAGLNNTGSAVVVANPTSTTTYWVNGGLNGCLADSVSVTVTVNPVPAKPAVVTPVTYCQNDVSTALSATALAGHTLTWYTDPSLTNGSNTTPIPSTSAGGTFTYYVTQTNSKNCVSDTSTISVTIQPEITGNTITADQTLCSAGAATTLSTSGTVSGGSGTFNYQWSRSTDGGTTWNDIAGSTAASYDPGTLTTTTVYRRLISSGLCSNVSNSITVTVLAPFTGTAISGTQTICEGTSPSLLDGQTASAGSGTVLYQWQNSENGSVFTDITGATTEDYQPPVLSTSTYYRRWLSNSTCTDTSNIIVVTVDAKPNGTINSPVSICVYDSALVTFNASRGSAPFSVILDVTDPGGTITQRTGNVPGNGSSLIKVIDANSLPGDYDVMINQITDDKGCSRNTGFAPATIVVYSKPVLSVSASTAICSGDSTTLTVSGAATYTWTPSMGLSADTGRVVSANPTATTTYTVNGSSNGCTAEPETVTVTVNPVPAKPMAITPVIYCEGATAVELSATNNQGNTVSWFTDATLTNGSIYAPTPSTGTPGTTYYYASQTSSFGCVGDTSRIAVIVNPLPIANFPLPTASCMDENGVTTVQFQNQSSVPGGGSYTSEWSFGDNNSSTDRNPVHTYYTPGPHQVTLEVTAANGCVSEVVKTLPAFLNKPFVNFDVAPDTLCQGTPSIFTDLSTSQASTIQTWNWRFGDGTSSSDKDPLKTYALPGNYTVRLSVMNAQGCESDTTHMVRVYLQPDIDAGPSFVVPEGTMVKFVPSVADSTNLTYEWTPGFTLSDPNDLRPTLMVMNDQVYKLTATGAGQCSASDTLSVKALLPLRIPNVFSPNGDGINDTWQIPNLQDYPGCTVEIFNRYGQSMFRSIGYERPWDGTLNGQPLPIGTYYYIIELKNGFNQVSGSVTILK